MLSVPLLVGSVATAAATVVVDWNSCPLKRSSAVSVLVAADPEWVPSGLLSRTSVGGVRALAEEGADNLRLLNFNIFPLISCAQVEEGIWNFTLMDRVVVPFLEAANRSSSRTIVDIETSPLWMWADAGACVKQSPSDPSCAWTGGRLTNSTCADANGTALPPGPRRRCPHWGDTKEPRDRSYRELGRYFARVAMWYTRGGFRDENGKWRESGYHFDESRITWEVWNEVNHAREHDMSAAEYIKMYDAHVAAMTTEMAEPASAVAPGGPWRGKIGGPSLGGLHSDNVESFMRPLLDPANHSPRETPLDALTFHQYAVCENNTAQGLESIFPGTRRQISSLQQVQAVRDKLRPGAELHLTESGIVCNGPKGCSGNHYSCYYKTADFQRIYWVASAAQWLYQYLLSAEAVDLATVAQSQILGYPAGFDGLSGEWPCGSMVDWTANKLNHKYWVQVALLQSVARPFSFCTTTTSNDRTAGNNHDQNVSNSAVYAQGLVSTRGQVLILINMKAELKTVHVQGARGKHAAIIDSAVGNEAAREIVLGADIIDLEAFGTMLIHWSNATNSSFFKSEG